MVDSEPGRGARLTLVLPEAELPEEAQRVKETAPPLRTSGREVLVIDDEPTVANVMTRLLRRFGQPAIAVTSPEDAIAAVTINPQRFWLVITDMSMPTMSGEETAQRLRLVGFTGALVLSSGTDFVVAGTPFDDVLPKPYEASAVRALLARQRDPAATQVAAAAPN